MQRQPLLRLGLSLAVNTLLCCTLLPFIIPSFESYSLSKLLEVLLWQSIGMVGWPLALVGLILSIPFGAKLSSIVPLLLMLIYPVIQFLLIRCMITKTLRRMDSHSFAYLRYLLVCCSVVLCLQWL